MADAETDDGERLVDRNQAEQESDGSGSDQGKGSRLPPQVASFEESQQAEKDKALHQRKLAEHAIAKSRWEQSQREFTEKTNELVVLKSLLEDSQGVVTNERAALTKQQRSEDKGLVEYVRRHSTLKKEQDALVSDVAAFKQQIQTLLAQVKAKERTLTKLKPRVVSSGKDLALQQNNANTALEPLRQSLDEAVVTRDMYGKQMEECADEVKSLRKSKNEFLMRYQQSCEDAGLDQPGVGRRLTPPELEERNRKEDAARNAKRAKQVVEKKKAGGAQPQLVVTEPTFEAIEAEFPNLEGDDLFAVYDQRMQTFDKYQNRTTTNNHIHFGVITSILFGIPKRPD